MPSETLTAFRRGAAESLPMQLATVPFGLIFGAVAIQAGLDVGQTLGMTTIVVAGAAQLAAIQLMAEAAPAWLAILTGAVINLRLAMYSASIAACWPGASLRERAVAAFLLHDQAYALSMRRYAERPGEDTPARLAYFRGVAISTILFWFAGCLAGVALGAGLPPAWRLDFAAPITFLALVAPLLRSAPHLAAAGAAGAAAVALAFLPLNLGLVVAGAAGVAAGAATEAALKRRGAR